MQVPFTALTNLVFTLELRGRDGTAPVLPDSFLDGSAPRLQHLRLEGFSFPGLPHLLLSTTGLVSLELRRIPHFWYISPDAMVAHLSTLTHLELLTIEFEFHRTRPDREIRHSPPPTRTLIPALTRLKFEGTNEYAEDLVTRIDTPLLKILDITFFDETVFHIPHLSHFISRHVPKFQAPPDEAHVTFTDDHSTATLSFPAPGYGSLALGVLCDESDEQLLSLIRLCRLFLPLFATVERLHLCHQQYRDRWRQRRTQGIQHSHWLQLLHIFTDTKVLYVSKDTAGYIVPVLSELVGERTTVVLPVLQNILFDGFEMMSWPSDIKTFIAARELSGNPITVYWGGFRGRDFPSI
jgi:hypothetical protein